MLCVVPNVVVLLSIIRMLKEFKGVSYCSPGHSRDKKVKSEESLTGNTIVVIWTGDSLLETRQTMISFNIESVKL